MSKILILDDDHAFGDLTREESLQSIGLFASDVMPALRAKAAAGGREMAGVAVPGRG